MNAPPWLARIVKGALFVLVAAILMPQPGYRGAPAALLAPAQYAVDLASLSGNVDPASTVFGLGPLSRLATRAPGLERGWALAFDLLVAAALIYGLALLLRRANSVEALLGILAGALVVEGVRAYVFPLAVLLWLILLVVLLDYVQRETVLSLLAAAGLSWALFYLQSSVGLAGLVMLGVVLLFRLAQPAARSRRFTALALAGWLALGPLLALLLGIDLPAHLRNVWRLRGLVAAPAPALAIGKSSGSEFLLLAVTILLIFAGALIASRRLLRGRAADWLACGLVGALLLLAFREAFVRPWGHPWLFFQAAMAVGILALFLATPAAARRFGGVFVAVLILSFPVVSGNIQGDYLTARVAALRSYTAWALNGVQPAVSDPRLEAYVLPPRLLEIIGDGAVDATADLLPFIVANDLAFQPSAAIRSLAELPGQIGSDGAPQFIMLGLDSDPARNPFPAGAPDRLDLLQDYRTIWRYSDAFLLLERLSQPRPLQPAGSVAGTAQLGEAVRLATPGGIQRVQIDLAPSLLGSLARSAALAPQVDLVTQFVDGQQARVRLTADQLRAGVQLAPVVDDLAAAELFSVASGLLNRPVERFWLRTAQPWAFKPQFAYAVDSFDAGNAAVSAAWPAVMLDDGQQLRLAAVQYDLLPGIMTLDLFWEVDPDAAGTGSLPAQTAFARLLDDQGNVVAAADGALSEFAPRSLRQPADRRRLVVARLRLHPPQGSAAAVYDLEVGLTPAGQPSENALWRTVLPQFVRIAPQQ